jgi:tight adherence protein C
VILLLLIGLVFAAVGATLLARAVAFPRVRIAQTLGQIDSYGYERAPLEAAEPAGALREFVDSIANVVGTFFARRLTTVRDAEIRRELRAAGFYRIQPRRFLGYQAMAAIGAPLVWIWFGLAVGLGGPLVVLGAIGMIGIGWWLPLVMVRSRAERRLKRIDYELPELIDVLVVTVEAGLGFSGSLRLASERFEGPLGDELRLTLQEQTMGLSTYDSLKNLLDRVDTPGMRSFVRSILQGEQLGVSIGLIMRELAAEMRKRRRATAEEKAHKAPIKILFPLVFLIFPAMFVILLAPALFAFVDAIG